MLTRSLRRRSGWSSCYVCRASRIFALPDGRARSTRSSAPSTWSANRPLTGPSCTRWACDARISGWKRATTRCCASSTSRAARRTRSTRCAPCGLGHLRRVIVMAGIGGEQFAAESHRAHPRRDPRDGPRPDRYGLPVELRPAPGTEYPAQADAAGISPAERPRDRGAASVLQTRLREMLPGIKVAPYRVDWLRAVEQRLCELSKVIGVSARRGKPHPSIPSPARRGDFKRVPPLLFSPLHVGEGPGVRSALPTTAFARSFRQST